MYSSKTGLISSPIKKIQRINNSRSIQLSAITKKISFTLKPYSELYNPYSNNCSALCNHPTDKEVKDLIRKTKNKLIDGKSLLLTEDIRILRETLQQIIENDKPCLDTVPEELFRRYTETDSRPLTPAPTVASGATRASGSRRCVTPDSYHINKIREKTLLVLDLRRSHSQETLSWYGSSSLPPSETPLIRIQKAPTTTNVDVPKIFTHSINKIQKNPRKLVSHSIDTPEIRVEEPEVFSSDEQDVDTIKRRGRRRKKKKRKKKRDNSNEPPSLPLDPETQVGVKDQIIDLISSGHLISDINAKMNEKTEIESFLDPNILNHLQRQLNREKIEMEFDVKRKKALMEALKNLPEKNVEKLAEFEKNLEIVPINKELLLKLPRIFKRSSARFELPMDSRNLEKMSPIDYLKDNVWISDSRKFFYNCVFNEHRNPDLDRMDERSISGNKILESLDMVMGGLVDKKTLEKFQELINWKNDDSLNFQTFSGLCALCERLLAPNLQDKKLDPCYEIEIADFNLLNKILEGKTIDANLLEILFKIKEQ